VRERIMKRCCLLAVFLVVLPGARPAGAQVAIGVLGGLDMSDLSGDAPPRVSYASRTGFAAGIIGEFDITDDVKLSLQPMFLQKGARIGIAVPGEEEPRDSLDLRLDYVTLPVLFKIVAGNGVTYAAGGIDLGYLLDATLSEGDQKSDVSDFLKRIDLAADFGFGVQLPIGSPFLTLELRYSQSILNLAKPGQGPEGDSLPVRFRSTGFQFLAGVLLPLGER
jgi:hypothetical protein